jgi:hypothetical protein
MSYLALKKFGLVASSVAAVVATTLVATSGSSAR